MGIFTWICIIVMALYGFDFISKAEFQSLCMIGLFGCIVVMFGALAEK